MKKIGCALLGAMMLWGCATCPVMTKCDFYGIPLGEPVDMLLECYGTPYSVCEDEDGREVWIYIEREMGQPGWEGGQIHYYLTLEGGEVVSKDMHYLEKPYDIIEGDRELSDGFQ